MMFPKREYNGNHLSRRDKRLEKGQLERKIVGNIG